MSSSLEWRLSFADQTLSDEATLRPVLAWLERLPGMEPSAYDLNFMENWRPWDLEKATVDALTQRTQVFRVKGGAEVVVALGKHDEPATAFLVGIDVDVAECFESIPNLARLVCGEKEWERV